MIFWISAIGANRTKMRLFGKWHGSSGRIRVILIWASLFEHLADKCFLFLHLSLSALILGSLTCCFELRSHRNRTIMGLGELLNFRATEFLETKFGHLSFSISSQNRIPNSTVNLIVTGYPTKFAKLDYV